MQKIEGLRLRFFLSHGVHLQFGWTPILRLQPAISEVQKIERLLINRLCRRNPLIGKARRLAQDFISMVRKQLPIPLTVWIRQAKASGLLELRRFASGLEQDYEAVRAALETPYSNGRVEGHVNRLKYLKRQMYGRASFELLRIRVLHSS
ncbi:transposase [Candidatus Glomeribacter gigasporarum]|uniref:transposase n=1 Tax=Candidatus Glomeribacter gigasporarum TaxID=132144 RepID=UPI0009DA1FE7|nr:transposase [Candidatus Glomeribacter gigasporarum]